MQLVFNDYKQTLKRKIKEKINKQKKTSNLRIISCLPCAGSADLSAESAWYVTVHGKLGLFT